MFNKFYGFPSKNKKQNKQTNKQKPAIFLECSWVKEIYKDLSDSEVRATASANFKALLEKVDRDKVNNIGKFC